MPDSRAVTIKMMNSTMNNVSVPPPIPVELKSSLKDWSASARLNSLIAMILMAMPTTTRLRIFHTDATISLLQIRLSVLTGSVNMR